MEKPDNSNETESTLPPEDNVFPLHTGDDEAAEDPKDAEIMRLKEELASVRDQWVRAVAEAENVRKRARKEIEDSSRYGVTAFARDMVSVLENLMRASEIITPAAKAENAMLNTLAEGVGLTQQELLGIFEKYGIKRIDPLGQKFDPNLHEAVVQVEQANVEPGTVIQVVQAGYIIHDRLLRPAMVAVSKASQPPKVEKVDTIV